MHRLIKRTATTLTAVLGLISVVNASPSLVVSDPGPLNVCQGKAQVTWTVTGGVNSGDVNRR